MIFALLSLNLCHWTFSSLTIWAWFSSFINSYWLMVDRISYLDPTWRTNGLTDQIFYMENINWSYKVCSTCGKIIIVVMLLVYNVDLSRWLFCSCPWMSNLENRFGRLLWKLAVFKRPLSSISTTSTYFGNNCLSHYNSHLYTCHCFRNDFYVHNYPNHNAW